MPAPAAPRLLEALHAESAAGLLPEADAQRLEAAYRFLRRTEHALQYREDEQTHLLPGDPPCARALAAALGMQAGEFEDTLAAHRAFVSRTFRNVFRLVGMGDAEEPAPAADAADKEEPDEQCALAGQIRQAFGDEADDLLRRARHADGQPPRAACPTPAAAASRRCCRPPCAPRGRRPRARRRRCGCST